MLSIFSFLVAVVNTEMYVVEEISNHQSHSITLDVDKISSLVTVMLSILSFIL